MADEGRRGSGEGKGYEEGTRKKRPNTRREGKDGDKRMTQESGEMRGKEGIIDGRQPERKQIYNG